MDLNEPMTLTDAEGKSVTLPLVNFLRLTVVKMQDLFIQYQQETKQSDIVGFNKWIKDKLDMTGKHVLA